MNSNDAAFDRREVALMATMLIAVFAISTSAQMGSALYPGISRLLNAPLTSVTRLASAWAFAGLLTPLVGPLSDRYGSWRLLLGGCVLSILSNFLSSIAYTLQFLMLAQAISGLGCAIFGFTAMAVIGDVFPYMKRGRAMGIIRIGVAGASLVGVPGSAAIADIFNPRGSYFGIGILVFLCIIPLYVISRKFYSSDKSKFGESSNNRTQLVLIDVLRQRSVLIGILAIMAWSFLPTSVFIYLAAWLEGRFSLSGSMIGFAFALVGVGAILGSSLTAMITDKLGKKRTSVLGLVLLSSCAIALPRMPTIVTTFIMLVVFTLLLEFSYGSYSTLLTELLPNQRGTVLSLVAFVNGVCTGIVPFLAGSIWEEHGYSSVTLLTGLIGMGISLLILFNLKEPIQPLAVEA
jgi:predicted MFS family arabinose efflux permease